MSEPVLRRSGRNAAKKDLPAPIPAVPVTKKRAAAETKKPAAKKVKTAVDKAAKTASAKTSETAVSSKTTTAPEKADRAGKASVKSAAKPSAKSATTKPVAKPALKVGKGKKADEAAEGLKDGDFLPKDLPEIQTEDGSKATISGLLETAQKGIIIFAYPKGT